MEEHKEPDLLTSAASSVTPEQLDRYGLEIDAAGYIGWRKDSPDHPRNWSVWRKTYDISLVMLFELYT